MTRVQSLPNYASGPPSLSSSPLPSPSLAPAPSGASASSSRALALTRKRPRTSAAPSSSGSIAPSPTTPSPPVNTAGKAIKIRRTASNLSLASLATSTNTESNNGNDEDDEMREAEAHSCFFSSQASTISAVSSLFDSDTLYGSRAEQDDAAAGAAGMDKTYGGISSSRCTTPAPDSPARETKLAALVAQEEMQMQQLELEDDDEAMTTMADLDTFLEEARAEAEEKETQPAPTNVYAHARTLLRYATAQEVTVNGQSTEQKTGAPAVVGRQRERAQVVAFLADRFPQLDLASVAADESTAAAEVQASADAKKHRSNCLYISGMPGTGKTALLKDVLQKVKRSNEADVNVVYINCVAVSQSKTVYAKIFEALGIPAASSASSADGDDEQKLKQALEQSTSSS